MHGVVVNEVVIAMVLWGGTLVGLIATDCVIPLSKIQYFLGVIGVLVVLL